MSRARKAANSPSSNLVMHVGKAKKQLPKVSFLLKLEEDVHNLLMGISNAEDRSMQWLLNKMTSEVIKRKAKELGITDNT